MPGIEEEMMIFLAAVFSGAIVRLTYRCISCFRQIVKHRRYAVEAEDLVFWTGAAIYLFVQIYHTSDGSIRWYFVLGVVIGTILMHFFVAFTKKIEQKLSDLMEKKNGKTIDKSGEKR